MTTNSLHALKECLAPFLGPNMITIGKHGVFVFPSRDTVIGRALDFYGEFAEDANELLVNFVAPGQVFVDVGANIGTVTIPLARRVGPAGTVLAVEPQRDVFTLLCANIALNGLVNVRPVLAALGAEPGTARIAGPNQTSRSNRGAVRLDTPDATEQVSMVTLDSIHVETCALIKIDVEGMESKVLTGAVETIERCRPVVYFEAKPSEGTRSCLHFLRQRNYSLHWHFARFRRPSNFRNVTEDIFDTRKIAPGTRIGDINALAVPAERNLRPPLPPISDPDADWRAEIIAWERAQRQKRRR